MHILKSHQWAQNLKRSVFIPISKKCNAKECSHHQIIALISHASKVMLKILQARLPQYVNWELPDVKVGFRKVTGIRDQIDNIHRIIRKQENSRKKKSTTASGTTLKHSTVWPQQVMENSFKRWYYNTILPASWENGYRSRCNSQNQIWNNGMVSNWEWSTSTPYMVTLLI